MISTAFDAANPDEKVQEFDQKYTELYGGGYDQNAPQSYDAVYVIKDAVERCIADGKDCTDGETLNELHFHHQLGRRNRRYHLRRDRTYG